MPKQVLYNSSHSHKLWCKMAKIINLYYKHLRKLRQEWSETTDEEVVYSMWLDETYGLQRYEDVSRCCVFEVVVERPTRAVFLLKVESHD